ncbi:MAG: sensor histidine kinase, partial [Bacteroidota bacterium]
LYECRAPLILLSDEIVVIRDYIELEKLRFSNRLSVELNEQTDDPEAMIAPLLLLPFVENSFKHGAGSTTGKAHIRIDIILRENELRFCVRNTMDSQANPAIEKGGIGLKNVQRQLELLYSGRYSLQAGQSGDQFIVELTLTLDEKSPAN